MCEITVVNTGHYFLGVTYIKLIGLCNILFQYFKCNIVGNICMYFTGIRVLIIQETLQSSEVTVESP